MAFYNTVLHIVNVFSRCDVHICFMQGRDLGRRFYDYTYSYSRIVFFLHFLTHTAWWWLLCATETCSCSWICYNKSYVSTDYVHIIVTVLTIWHRQIVWTKFQRFKIVYLCTIGCTLTTILLFFIVYRSISFCCIVTKIGLCPCRFDCSPFKIPRRLFHDIIVRIIGSSYRWFPDIIDFNRAWYSITSLIHAPNMDDVWWQPCLLSVVSEVMRNSVNSKNGDKCQCVVWCVLWVLLLL